MSTCRIKPCLCLKTRCCKKVSKVLEQFVYSELVCLFVCLVVLWLPRRCYGFRQTNFQFGWSNSLIFANAKILLSFLLQTRRLLWVLNSSVLVYWRRKEVHVNCGRGRGLMKMRHAATASRWWRLTTTATEPDTNHVTVNSS